jgi:hypothetical protein
MSNRNARAGVGWLAKDRGRESPMNDTEYERLLIELDHLFNDPKMPIEPDHIWALLAEISHHDRAEAG